MKYVITVAFVTFLLPGHAFGDATADAKAHYQSATAHFAVGEFAEAATEYQAAFVHGQA